MTAVATPNYQPLSRPGWNPSNGGQGNLTSMNADEVSRMFLPRKSTQRANSSSSIASSPSSTTSAVATPSTQTNGAQYQGVADLNGFGPRKKPARGLWPASKAEPISGISTARSESVSINGNGPSAASGLSALQNPSQSSQQMAQSQSQQTAGSRAQGQNESPAILHLLPMNGTFERKTINVPFYPEVLRIGRQTNQKTIPTPSNGYFDSKVLSRQHAEIWADRSGKIWIRDVKSSNGTFVNAQRLSAENRDSEPHELRERDVLELGIDIVSEDQKTIVHHKVAAKVEHAGIYGNSNNIMDLNFGDLDQSGNGGLLPQQHGQNGGLRGRAGSQGSVGSNRSMGSAVASTSNMSAVSAQRQAAFWLTPVTMEQIVKRLNSELKQAKQQSQDLQRTNHYMDAILSGQTIEESKAPPVQPVRPTPLKGDARARFSDPPAPPPSQPLPEKPDAARINPDDSISQPLLRRSNTARPPLSNGTSPTKLDPSLQITSLVEALTTAKKELDTQNLRLKDLEDMLAQERLARESAEDRAMRLEMQSRNRHKGDSDNDSIISDSEVTVVDTCGDTRDNFNAAARDEKEVSRTADEEASATRLQQRLDLMLAQMDEMRQMMSKYRERAESAEAESAKSRASLAEMVEKIRRDDATRAAKASHISTQLETPTRTAYDGAFENGRQDRSPGALVKKAGIQMDGKPIGAAEFAELEKVVLAELKRSKESGCGAAEASEPGIVVQSTPYVTMVGVVLLGWGLMNYLNGWQKVVER